MKQAQTRNAIGEKNLSRAALPIVYDTKIQFFQKLDFLHPPEWINNYICAQLVAY